MRKCIRDLSVVGLSKCFIMAAICLCVIAGQAQARDLKASLPIIPPLSRVKRQRNPH